MNHVFYVIPLLLVISIPTAFAQTDFNQNTDGTSSQFESIINDSTFESVTTIDKTSTTITNADGTYTWTSHIPYVLNNSGNWVPYILGEDDSVVQVQVNGGTFVFDKINGAVTIFDETGIVIDSDSYVVRTATLNSDEWNNLEVNNSEVETIVSEEDDTVIVSFVRENDEGQFITEYIISNGKVKTTAYFTNYIYDNHKFAFTQTVSLPDSIISLNDMQDIDLNNFVGQSFPREVLEQNQDLILQIKDMYYNSGLGFENLWQVNIHENNTISLDYANVEQTQTAINETVELDPTWGYSQSNNEYTAELLNDVSGNSCSSNGWRIYSGYYHVFVERNTLSGGSPSCAAGAVDFDISAIPDTATITDVDLRYDVAVAYNSSTTCDFNAMTNSASSYVASGSVVQPTNSLNLFNDATSGINFVNADSSCSTTGQDKIVDLGTNADSNLESKLSGDVFSVGIAADSYVRTANYQNMYGGQASWASGNGMDLQVTYTAPPTVPTNLSASQSVSNQIELNWTASSGQTPITYDIYRYNNGWSSSPIVSGLTTTTYIDQISGNEIDASLTYYVKAINAAGYADSANSNAIQSWGYPDAPTGLSAVSGIPITMTWNTPNSDAEISQYKIYRDGTEITTLDEGLVAYYNLDNNIQNYPALHWTWDSNVIAGYSNNNDSGFTINGNTITPTQSSNGWTDNNIRTVETIHSSNGGEISFSGNGGNNLFLGLGKDPFTNSASYGFQDIEYAIHLVNSNTVEIRENGTNKLTTGETYSSSDIWKVKMDDSGTVTYWKNGSLLNTSTITANGDYYGQASIYTNYSSSLILDQSSVTGTETYTTGEIEKGFAFDGSTEITLNNEPDFDFDSSDPFSVSFWFKIDPNTGSGQIVSKGGKYAAAFKGWGIEWSSGYQQLNFVSSTSTSGQNYLLSKLTGGENIDDGNWHHMVLTYDGTLTNAGLSPYLDGVLKTPVTIATNTSNSGGWLNNDPLTIGNTSPSVPDLYFDGVLDEVKIYDRELSSSEVSQLYNYDQTSFQDDNTIMSNSYNYQVSAVSAVGESALSSTSNASAGIAPDAPTGVSTTIQDVNNFPLNVDLSWSSPNNVGTGTLTGFEVWRNGSLITTTGLVTSYTDTVTAGTHSYYLKSISTHGTSGNSGSSSVTTPGVPSAINDLSGSVISDSQINLSWSAPNSNGSNIDLYKIFKDGVQVDTTTNLNYSLTGLTANTAYTITVYANNSVGDSLVSNSVNLTTYQSVSGGISITTSTQGATTEFSFAPNITGTPTPNFNTFTLMEGTNVIASGITSPYYLAHNDDVSKTYSLTSTDNSHWNSPTITGTITAQSDYAPNWNTQNISYNYTRNSGVMDLTVNKDNSQNTWDAVCSYKTTTEVIDGDPGISSTHNSIWFISESQSINDADTVYVSCVDGSDQLFSFTSFGPNRLAGGIAQLDNVFGDMTGTPVALIFVLLVAGLFTGRSAPTGILLVLALVGVLGFIGMLTIDEAVWGFLLLAGVLGIFIGKRFL